MVIFLDVWLSVFRLDSLSGTRKRELASKCRALRGSIATISVAKLFSILLAQK